MSTLPKTQSNSTVGRYTQSEIREFVKNYKNPRNIMSLHDLSENLYVQSKPYQRLINYWSDMPTYDYAIVPRKSIQDIDKEKVTKDYNNICELMGQINVKHTLRQVVKKSMISDVFYGYVYHDMKNESFMIQQIPFDLCKISSSQDNVYNFAINLKELSSRNKRVDLISFFPLEIQNAFKTYENQLEKNKGDKPSDWYEILPENSICFKVLDMTEAVPPFASLFDSIADIASYKQLRRDKDEIDNYKLIAQKLPLRKDSVDNNDFAIDLNMVNFFHNSLEQTLPENIGLASTPMDLEVITFDKDVAKRNDGVAEATKDFWDNSGTSQILFSSDNKTSQGVLKNIEVDEQTVYSLLKQLEAWINRFIILNKYSEYFRVNMLEITHFNREKVISMFMQQGQNGVPVKTVLSSLLGFDTVSFNNMLYFENEVLDLHDKMNPLNSSYTTSSKDKGRPTNEETGQTDSDETLRGRDKTDSVEE